MSQNDQESINDYLMNHKNSNYSNMNTTKLTELSQIMNQMEQKQNNQIFQNLDNPSPIMTTNSNDIQQQLLSQFESTPYHLVSINHAQNNSNLSSLPHTEQKSQKHPYFSNISPVSRFQAKISAVGSQCPVSGSSRTSQIIQSNTNNNIYQQINAFTPQNNFGNKASFFGAPNTSSFTQNAQNINHSNSTSIGSNKFNAFKNKNSLVRNDENDYQMNHNLVKDGVNYSQSLNMHKYELGQDGIKLFSQSEQSPNSKQTQSTINLLAKIKNEDEMNYQREMTYANQYLSKVYSQKNGLNNISREELPPNFGAILAKRTSPPLKGKNISNNIGSINQNSSQNQSGILQLTTIQSQNNLVTANSNSISGLNNNQSVGQYLNQFQKSNNFQNNSGQKNQFSMFGHQTSLNQTHDSIKNKSTFGVFAQKDEKSIQESKAYLSAMKALQERIKELEKQLNLTNEQEIRQYLENQYQQSIEESGEIIENLNQKNIVLEQQIGSLINEIEQYKNIITDRESDFQIQREEWLKGNAERNSIIESHIQKQAQMNNQLQEEIERNHQLQIELNETQQKWQLLHQEHQHIEARRIEQLQRELEEEKSQHNELKSLCVKSTEEIETLLNQNKTLDHKLQIKEKEFDEYKIQFNQNTVDLLKDQIKEQKDYLDKIEENMKQTYEAKQIQLETELNNARLIEKQLRNEITEIKKGIMQKSRDQLNHSIFHSPQSQNKMINNSTNNVNAHMNQNQNNIQNQNQMVNAYQQNQLNPQNYQQSNSQSELEKYLSPSAPINNKSLIQQQIPNGYNSSIEQQLTLIQQNQMTNQPQNQMQQQFQNQMMNQNPNQLMNQSNLMTNQLLNQQNINQSYNQMMMMNNQQLQQLHHGRKISHQVNEMEQFSLQEESDLLNFDYDELQQQSRLNSKSSPIISNRHYKQIMSLDSPLRKKSSAQNNQVSSSLQITKQFQDQSLQNSLSNNQYSFMQSQHQNQDSSPQNIQNTANTSPFFTPSYPIAYDDQQSPDFKPQNINSLKSTGKDITHRMNLTGGIKDNWSFKDQLSPTNQLNIEKSNQLSQFQQLQMQDSIQEDMNKQQQLQIQRRNEQNNQVQRLQQKQLNQMQPSSYLQYSDTINNELEYKKQTIALANKRSKSSNQSLHKQQQTFRQYKNSADNINPLVVEDSNQEYPSNIIGNELIRDIFEAESEQKLLNQRYEVLLTESRNEENSKKKSEIRKELITISEKIKILNEKLYVLKKREKFIMSQQYQRNNLQNDEKDQQQNQQSLVNRQQQSSSLHLQQGNYQ